MSVVGHRGPQEAGRWHEKGYVRAQGERAGRVFRRSVLKREAVESGDAGGNGLVANTTSKNKIK